MNWVRRLSAYLLAYLLWAASFGLGAAAIYRVREVYLSIVVASTRTGKLITSSDQFYQSLQTRALDTWSLLFAGIALIVLIVYLENLMRTGVQSGQLWHRFFSTMVVESGVLSLASLAYAITAGLVAGFTYRSFYSPITETILLGICLWLWSRVRQQKPILH